MSADTEASPADSIAAGWQALAQGAWEEARALFASAVAREETAEALEGLGMAAWWVNDTDGSFRAREAAYRRYLDRSDRAAAARVAIFLSMDHCTRRGRHAVASGWLRRAHRLLGGLDPSPEHALAAAWEGHMAILVEHDAARARRLGAEAATLARALGSIDLEMLGGALEGYARVCQGDVAEGMRLLDETAAAAAAGEMTDLDAITLSCCYLIYACERVRDFGRAAQWCDHLRELATRWSYQAMFSFCRTHYAGVLISRGAWEQAEAELLAATEELAASHPALAVEGIVRLAELRRYQGRLDEADELFSRLDDHPLRMLGSTPALIGRAALALDRGDAPVAAALAERYLRAVPESDRLQRTAGLELLVRARVALADHAGAAETLRDLATLSAGIPTLRLQAVASFSAGVVAVATGDYAEARRRFEDALDLAERSDAPYEAARARLELAGVLAGMGQAEAAVAEASSALAALQRLGAAREAERAATLIAHVNGQREREASASRALTARELEILRLVARGLSDKEIAAALGLSLHTIHRHISNILSKLALPSRAAAVAHAAQRGLL
jgi:DNA-binding NarL/FixJ family response regulator